MLPETPVAMIGVRSVGWSTSRGSDLVLPARRVHDPAMRACAIRGPGVAIMLSSLAAGAGGCGGGDITAGGPGDDDGPGTLDDAALPLPSPSCDPAPGGGTTTVATPTLTHTVADR